MAPPMGASASAAASAAAAQPPPAPAPAPATGQDANAPVQDGASADSTSTNATAGSTSSASSITSSSSSRSKAVPDEESEIAKMWHKACPTLRTIILPKGKVWFQAQSVVAAAQQVQALTAPAVAPAPAVSAPISSSTLSQTPDLATSSATETDTILPSDALSAPDNTAGGDDAGTPMEVVETDATSEPPVQPTEWAHL